MSPRCGEVPAAHQQRLAGVNDPLQRVDLAPAKLIEYGGADFAQANYSEIGERLADAIPDLGAVDGVGAPNDVVAIGVERALISRGLSIPDDKSIVSFDNGPTAEWAPVRLTSVSLHGGKLGANGISLLIDEVENDHNQHTHVHVSPTLVARDSTKR